MRRTGITAVLLALLLALCACGGGDEAESTALRIYLPADGAPEELLAQAIVDRDYYGGATVEGFLGSLLPALMGGEAGLNGWTREGDALWVDLEPGAGELTGIDRTLLQSCIVLTLLQVEGVERVCVTEGGEPFAGTERVYLTGEDMLFSGAEEQPREVTVGLCFPRAGGRGLGFEERVLIITEEEDLYTAVTRALLEGPASSELSAPFPEGVEVLDARVEDGICYVSFSAALVDNAAESMAERDLLVYSIVDTLGNLDAVEAVQLLVEGESPGNYGNTDVSLPLEPDFGLIGRD